MKSFYQFALSYRGLKDKNDPRKQLSDWMFYDHEFPKHTSDYEEISRYLEIHSPFKEAISTFDLLWERYIEDID